MTRSRVRRLAVLGATVLATVALGATQAAASPVGPSSPSSTSRVQSPSKAPAATLTAGTARVPADCGVKFSRVDGNSFASYGFRGSDQGRDYLGVRNVKFQYGDLGLSEPVRAMTVVNGFAAGSQFIDQYLATTGSGALHLVRNHFDRSTDTFLYTEVRTLKTSGWGGVRELAFGDSGLAYALTDSGGLYRYSLSTTGVVKSAGTVATTGWSGITDLTWSYGGLYKGVQTDGLVGVTAGGALVEYVVRTSDAVTRSFVLASSGWGKFVHVSTGGCSQSPGRPIAGTTADGIVTIYYDYNAFDLNGGDIRTVGDKGYGFSGLLFD